MKVIEKELRDLKVEHELLLQAFQTVNRHITRLTLVQPGSGLTPAFRQVQQERDELLKKQMEAIMDVQQKSGLKELVLDRKLAALTDTVEKREAQLCALLSTVDQTEGSSAANKLKVGFVSRLRARVPSVLVTNGVAQGPVLGSLLVIVDESEVSSPVGSC